jgi:predicted XRE-type DNA-binding protein
MTEEWKTIPDFTDYAVSDKGRVKRVVKRNNSWAGKILKPRKNSKGYLYVGLYCNSKMSEKYVHCLVLSTFRRTYNDDAECNHRDGDKTNNKLDNLEFCTHSENMKHAYDTELNSHRGEKSHLSKLTECEVYLIKSMLYNTNYMQKEIATIFHVSRQAISLIKTGERWKHVLYPNNVNGIA